MKKITKFLIFISIVSIFLLPAFSFAADAPSSSLVPCGVERYPIVEGDVKSGMVKNPCGFNDIMTLINNVVTFIFKDMVIPIAAIMFAYAGVLLIFSGGDTSKRSKAKSIFINTAIGFIIAIAAWLIVYTILSTLGYDTTWNWFGFEKKM